MNLDLFNSMNEDELFKLCKEHKIQTFNIKTKKNFSKKTLINNLSKIINNNSNSNIETKFKNCIKSCHKYLYSNGSIVGNEASNDIIRIFILKVISYLYSNNPENKTLILSKIESLKTDENYERYLSYLEKFSNLEIIGQGFDDVNSNYEEYMDDVIKSKLLNLIFTERNDYLLNTRNDNRNIFKLIEELDKIDINENTIDEFSTISIYEYFNSSYEGKTTSKKLGQFFTPKKMINSILNDCNFIDDVLKFENPSIYDPCCGTAGLLCNLFKSCDNIKASNIYGTEIHKDTIKYALASLLLSTNSLFQNLNKGCSLSNNKFLFQNKKFDIIFTNPPFGTEHKYNEIKEKFNYNKPSNLEIKFEDVFPIDTNVGINLFIQLIIYLLNENGIACIILPDGELMDGKTSFKIREFIIKNCKVLKIISFPQKAFEYTSIKTNVLILKKNKNDENNDNYKNVEFIEVNKECNEAKRIGIKDLNKNLSFHFNDEINNNDDYKEIEGIEIKELKEVCEFLQKKNKLKASDGLNNGLYNFYTSSQNNKLYYNSYEFKDFSLIIGRGGNPSIHYDKEFSISHDDVYVLKNKENINNLLYIYYYLKSNILLLYDGFKGVGIKHISKEYINQIKIPIPSLEIQEDIIKKCEFLTDFNKKLESDIKDLKECDKIEYDCFLRNNINNQEKEIKQLKELCNFLPKSKRNAKFGNDSGLYPFFRSSLNVDKYVNEPDYNEESLIIGDGGEPNINYCNKFSTSDHCYVLQNNNNYSIKLKYIYYYLLNNLNEMKKLYTGLAIKNISKTNIEGIKIPIPSIEIQEKFINYCENRNNNTYNITIRNIEKTIEDNKKIMKELFNFQ